MQRALLIVAVAALLAGCGGGEDEPAAPDGPATALEITVRPQGPGGPSAQWTLECDPAGGSLPDPEGACGQLAGAGRAAFDPVPEDAICTEIYGGPQVATVSGTLEGEPVTATFTRINGCEIERWDRLGALLPEDDGT